MAERRIEIVLNEDRYQKLLQTAEQRHLPLSAVIDDAIDQLEMNADARRNALEAILNAPTMPVPTDPAELRREIDASRDIWTA